MTGLSDSFDRPINYLRISITDRCNLRCTYCMPLEGIETLKHGDILRYEEILDVAKAAAELGVNKVRLTGGEPLVRAGLSNFVSMLSEVGGLDDLSVTTNGVMLTQHANDLKTSGLNRVNVSLDSLQPGKFEQITRIGTLNEVLKGIEFARTAGLDPVKINMVIMRGINDDEIVDFARKTIEEEWHVRFIEFMPVGNGQQEGRERFMPISDITEQVESLGPLTPHKLDGNGPAKYFRLPDSRGTIGFISPVSEHFCFQCNRLRLTADGKLRPCLLSDDEVDLRDALRQGASIDDLKKLVKQAIDSKPECHNLKTGNTAKNRSMCQIGG